MTPSALQIVLRLLFCLLIVSTVANMATYGRIEPFSGNGDEFNIYIERLTQYLEANDLEEIALLADNSNADAVTARNGKRRAILLSVMGNSTYSLVRNLVSPDKPGDKTFDQIVNVLKSHFKVHFQHSAS
jgi:hypothetical protein